MKYKITADGHVHQYDLQLASKPGKEREQG
jgi:hypothetical protein